MHNRSIASTVATLCTACFIFAGAAEAAEIKVLASAAIKEAYGDFAPQFEKSSEHKITTTWAGTVDIVKKLQAGEVFDVVIGAAPIVEGQVKAGKLTAKVNIARSGVGVAVSPGTPKPDLSSTEAVKRALLSAKSIGYSSGPSGTYLAGLFQRLGIADAIKTKLKQTPSGVAVGSLVASGEAELGFQQVSELLHFPGITYVGPLPADIQEITQFSASIHVSAPQAEAGRAFVRFITSPPAATAIKHSGMEPG
jgi:molybdate transport system substrate-binding protein